VCPGLAIDTARACGDLVTPTGKFLAHSGRVVTTDLFLAAAGLDPLVLERAVPPACLRGIDPAPIAVRDGRDTLLMLPTWTPRQPVAHLLPSFAPLTEAPIAFRFELSVHTDGEWSAWAASTTIGVADFAPLPSAVAPLTCDVDVFRAAPAVHAVRLRVRVRAGETARWLVGLSAADDAPADLRPSAGPPTRLDVPPLSQLEADATLGARICSPTSVAMVLGYWRCAVTPSALAAEVFHPELDIYGVWPSAIRAAASRGVAGYLLRFPDWVTARWCLERGIPIVASVRYAAGELTDAAVAATAGHLLVLVGVDGDTVLVNDPAAPTADSVARRYRADEFGCVWLARGGVGYVLFDPARV